MNPLKILLLPFALVVSACKGQPPLETSTNGKTLLWEISGQGLTKPSYFLGTMHVLCPQDAIVSSQVQAVLDIVDQVYFEVDLDDMAQLFSSLKAMMMKDGKKLEDLYTKEEYERVKEYFEGKLPLPFSMMERYKPMLLSGMVAEKELPCESANGMELLILEECTRRNMDVKGLETMEYQASLFDSIPYELQAKELLKSIDSSAVQGEGIAQLIKVYREQDLDGIEKLTVEEEGGIQENLELLLYGRNKHWVQQFAAIAEKQPTLFAVGAGHLPGAQGVLNLLKSMGYKLRPLKNDIGIKRMSL